MWTQRSIDVEKAVCEEIYRCREGVRRWDPCHVDSEEIYRCRAGVRRWDPCHVDSEEIYRCRAGVRRWDPCHVNSEEIYRCREGVRRWDPCHVNSEEIYRCREGVRRWDLCHVDSVEIYRCREGCTEMGPLPCGLEGDLARYRECQILGRTWSTHVIMNTHTCTHRPILPAEQQFYFVPFCQPHQQLFTHSSAMWT